MGLHTIDSPTHRRRALRATVAGAVVALALFAHRDVPGCALLGADAYPQILAARIQSWMDFVDTFRETLTDGQISGAYFRPVQNLLLAANYAMGGLDPRPYQLTSWAAVGCMAALLFLTLARLLGAAALLAPLAAAALVALHPVLVSVVHGPATRSELLVVIFLLAGLLVLPLHRLGATPAGDRRCRSAWAQYLAAGLFSLLAAGSKDTGAVAPLLVFVHQFGFAPHGGPVTRLRRAALAAIPSAIAVGAFLVLRTQVVGGLGGLPGRQQVYSAVLTATAPSLAPAILCPGLPAAVRAPFATAAVLLGLLATAGCCAWISAGDSSARRARRTLLALGTVWALCSIPLLGFVQSFYFYYAMFPLIGVAFIVAAALEAFGSTIRALPANAAAPCEPGAEPDARRVRSSASRCIVPVVGAAAVLPILLGGLYASPLWRDYPQYERASRLHRALYARIEVTLDSARPGDLLRFDMVRRVTDLRAVDRSLPVASITSAMSIEAWAWLRFPGKSVRVFDAEREPFPPRAGDAIVLVVRSVEPAEFEAAAAPAER